MILKYTCIRCIYICWIYVCIYISYSYCSISMYIREFHRYQHTPRSKACLQLLRFWHRCRFIIFTSFTSQGGERVMMEKFHKTTSWQSFFFPIVFLFRGFLGSLGGVYFWGFHTMERYERWWIDGWMSLDALLGKCPQKRKVKSFDVFNMTYYVSQDGGVRRSKLWNFAKKRQGCWEIEVFSHASPWCICPNLFMLFCICCCGMVFVKFCESGAKQTFCYGNAGIKKTVAFKHSISSNSIPLGQERRVFFLVFVFLRCCFVLQTVLFSIFQYLLSFLHHDSTFQGSFQCSYGKKYGKIDHPTSVGRFYIETSSLRISCSSSRLESFGWTIGVPNVFFWGVAELEDFGSCFILHGRCRYSSLKC